MIDLSVIIFGVCVVDLLCALKRFLSLNAIVTINSIKILFSISIYSVCWWQICFVFRPFQIMITKLILHGVIKWKSDSESNHSRLITKIKLNTHKLKEGRLHSGTHCSHISHIVSQTLIMVSSATPIHTCSNLSPDNLTLDLPEWWLVPFTLWIQHRGVTSSNVDSLSHLSGEAVPEWPSYSCFEFC